MTIVRVLVIYGVLFGENVFRAEETTEMTSTTSSTVMIETMKDSMQWVGDEISNAVQSIVPITEDINLFDGRTMCPKRKKHHKKNKLLMPLLVGFLLIKSIILPIALKAVAVLSGKAFILSIMSLVLGAIVGLRRIADGLGPTGFSYDGYSKYRRKDHLLGDRTNFEDNDSYRYYRDQNERE